MYSTTTSRRTERGTLGCEDTGMVTGSCYPTSSTRSQTDGGVVEDRDCYIRTGSLPRIHRTSPGGPLNVCRVTFIRFDRDVTETPGPTVLRILSVGSMRVGRGRPRYGRPFSRLDPRGSSSRPPTSGSPRCSMHPVGLEDRCRGPPGSGRSSLSY